MHTREEKMEAFGRLLDVLDNLRVNCPWDRKQTFESLRPNTIEEVYELCDALLHNDLPNICKELGDVIMHVMFYARIADEQKAFDIADVCHAEADKLIRRHPHIYGDVTVENTRQVLENWEQIKLKESGGNKRVLAGVPTSLPAMIKAYRIQEKAQNVGFDWKERHDVWKKVREELAELEAELENNDNSRSMTKSNEESTLLLAQAHSKTIPKSSPAKGVKTTFTPSVLKSWDRSPGYISKFAFTSLPFFFPFSVSHPAAASQY